MNKNVWLSINFSFFLLLFSVVNLSAQQDFDKFWTKFKTAVMQNEKQKVADLTKFPLLDESENDEGSNPSYSRTKFLRDYRYFFNQQSKLCFQNPKFVSNNNSKTELILVCTNGLSYMFERTKRGWKWINFNRD